MWIGEWMEKRGNREDLIIATKFTSAFSTHGGHRKDKIHSNSVGNGSKSLRTSLDASLQKLKTEYVDILYVHWWDYTVSIEELMQSLNDVVKSGKVLYLGISDTPAWIVSKCNQYARDHGLRQFVVYQGLWSAATRDFERDIIPMAKAEGMGLAPWGVLGGGGFKTDEARKKGEGRDNPPSANHLAASKALEAVAKRHGNVDVTSIALAYVMHKTTYVFPICGGRTIGHLKGNMEALTIELSAEDMKEIDGAPSFDIGFPQNIMGGAKGDVWLTNRAGHFDHVESEKAIVPGPIDKGTA